ncbi:DoxX family protein [Alkalihalobacillus macyae]|uniref:DoxX family protein n=1 Tax=Guptibacillus hwajinpoensis TaxID=208199 RepID=UPI00273CAC6D|nr:DoxX family protein [Alkalihalobacillus macyae]MDP4552200.1 DoxX family protein [Alkalihalobacillus macyae]
MKTYPYLGLLTIRLIVGMLFFAHGFFKFSEGIANTAAFFEAIGLSGFLAYVVGLIELIGGVLMILGLGTRIVSVLFSSILIGALILVKRSTGMLGGYELDIALLAMSLSLFLSGGGPYSLRHYMVKKGWTLSFQQNTVMKDK